LESQFGFWKIRQISRV